MTLVLHWQVPPGRNRQLYESDDDLGRTRGVSGSTHAVDERFPVGDSAGDGQIVTDKERIDRAYSIAVDGKGDPPPKEIAKHPSKWSMKMPDDCGNAAPLEPVAPRPNHKCPGWSGYGPRPVWKLRRLWRSDAANATAGQVVDIQIGPKDLLGRTPGINLDTPSTAHRAVGQAHPVPSRTRPIVEPRRPAK